MTRFRTQTTTLKRQDRIAADVLYRLALSYNGYNTILHSLVSDLHIFAVNF